MAIDFKPKGSINFKPTQNEQPKAPGLLGKIGALAKGVAVGLAGSVVRPLATPAAGFVSGIEGLAGTDSAAGNALNRVAGVNFDKPELASKQLGARAIDAALLAGAGTSATAGKAALGAIGKGEILKAAGTGAISGLAPGAMVGASEALQKGESAGDIAKGALSGAATGALAGGVLSGAAAGVVKSVKIGGKIIAKVKQIANDANGDQVREALSTVDTPTLNVLDPNRTVPKVSASGKTIAPMVKPDEQKAIKESLDAYLKQAKRAVENPAENTPLEMAGRKAEEALAVYQEKLNKWGSLKQEALGANGNNIVDLTDVKRSAREIIAKRLGAVLDDGYNVVNAPGTVSKITLDPADQALVRKVVALVDHLDDQDTLFRVDGTVDALQDLLYKAKKNTAIPIGTSTESALKGITKELNGLALQAGGPTYQKANAKYASFIDSRDMLNKLLGSEGSKGGSLMKRVFSPTDGGTKNLFAKVKKEVGVDLVREATLAKFAMENAGDLRQKSLLESIDLLPKNASVTGLLKKILEVAQKQVANPVDVAKKAATGAVSAALRK